MLLKIEICLAKKKTGMSVEKSLRIYWHFVSGIVRMFTYKKVYCYEHQEPNVLFFYKNMYNVYSSTYIHLKRKKSWEIKAEAMNRLFVVFSFTLYNEKWESI